MKQIWPDYSYSPTTNVLTLTGLNIDRDQLLLVAAPERGRIMYNFADSAVTASAYTAGANTALTLVASTAGLTTTASLVIYYDDQLQSTAITISNFPATQPVSIASVTIGNTVTIAGTVTANPTGTQTIAGTVTANLGSSVTLSAVENNDIGAFWGEVGAGNPTYAVNTGWLDSDNFISGTSTQNPFPVQVVSAGTFRYFPSNTTTAVRVILGREDGSEWRENTGNVPIPVNIVQTGAYAATSVSISGTVTIGNTVTIAGTVTANPTGTQTIAGTVTANLNNLGGGYFDLYNLLLGEEIPVSASLKSGLEQIGSVTASLSAGTNRIGVVTIGAGTVTIGAGTAQIGSVTASISGTVPISISSVTVGNSVTIGSLPAISGTVTANINTFPDATTIGEQIAQGFTNYGGFDVAIAAGTAQIGSVTASISNSVTISGTVTANTFALQGTAVTTSNFTSTTASTVLAGYNATREVLTIFNEGAGNLHICAGATCTTIAYQVRLSAGDYYEVPNHQTTITHSAVFATAGTARVTQLS